MSREPGALHRELFAKEQAHLQPLPLWRSPVYRLFHRQVDFESYVSVHAFRYEVPSRLIGQRLEVRETKRQLLFFHGPRQVATHTRAYEGKRRIRLPETQREDRKRLRRERMAGEEKQLRAELPDFSDYIAKLRKRAPRGQSIARLRRLRRMLRDYPREPLLRALGDAAHYGLYDLDRVEKMALRNIKGDFFPRSGPGGDDIDNDDEG